MFKNQTLISFYVMKVLTPTFQILFGQSRERHLMGPVVPLGRAQNFCSQTWGMLFLCY